MSINVVEGRWFSREDEGQRWDAIVINRAMAQALFGDQSAVGRMMPEEQHRDPANADRPGRIVGVIEEFRQFGEFSTPDNYLFVRNDLSNLPALTDAPEPAAGEAAAAGGAASQKTPQHRLPSVLSLRVRPGVTAAFEERLNDTLHALAPEWSFGLQPLENLRANMHRQDLTPLVVLALVSGFLLVMVALGLSGVLWQTVTQRIRELGLRRAKGASRERIRRQILGELALMTLIAVAGGLLLLVQVPMLGWLGPVAPSVYATSLAIAAAVILLLTSACGWYPSLLATRIPPAEALRYE